MYRTRRLSMTLQMFFSLRFPYKTSKNYKHRYQAVIGIGGNIGDMRRRFEHLFYYLKREKRVALVQTSLILKNPPFGFVKLDDFFNSILVLQVSMQPIVFLDYLMRLEKKFARKRSFVNAPRTLDLDIIFFDNRVVDKPTLQIPHAKWFERDSVIIPLRDIEI